MKHKLAKVGLGFGLSLGLCGLPQPLGELEPVPANAFDFEVPAFKTTTTVEQINNQSKAAYSIVSKLGGAGLYLVKVTDEQALGVKILVTPDGQCASEYAFVNRTPGDPGTEVEFLNYGKASDLIDKAKVNSHAEYDGTIGHGDNIISSVAELIPDSPDSIQNAINYIKDSTDMACSPE